MTLLDGSEEPQRPCLRRRQRVAAVDDGDAQRGAHTIDRPRRAVRRFFGDGDPRSGDPTVAGRGGGASATIGL